MDYRKLNSWTEKDHFPMPFMDQMLDRLAGKGWYCFLDGYSGYNEISIAPADQEKTPFTEIGGGSLSITSTLARSTSMPFSEM